MNLSSDQSYTRTPLQRGELPPVDNGACGEVGGVPNQRSDGRSQDHSNSGTHSRSLSRRDVQQVAVVGTIDRCTRNHACPQTSGCAYSKAHRR